MHVAPNAACPPVHLLCSTVWIYCGEDGGCNNGYNVFYDYASCGLRHQDVPPNQLNGE